MKIRNKDYRFTVNSVTDKKSYINFKMFQLYKIKSSDSYIHDRFPGEPQRKQKRLKIFYNLAYVFIYE